MLELKSWSFSRSKFFSVFALFAFLLFSIPVTHAVVVLEQGFSGDLCEIPPSMIPRQTFTVPTDIFVDGVTVRINGVVGETIAFNASVNLKKNGVNVASNGVGAGTKSGSFYSIPFSGGGINLTAGDDWELFLLDWSGFAISSIMGSAVDAFPDGEVSTFPGEFGVCSNGELLDLYFSFFVQATDPTISFAHPSATGTQAVFDAFEVNFDDLFEGLSYTFQVRYGTASTTIDDINEQSGFGWDDWSATTQNWVQFPASTGIVRLPTGFQGENTPFATGTDYFARGYLFTGTSATPSALIASTNLISFDFNDNQPIANFPDDVSTVVPADVSVAFTGAKILAGTFPFAYFYQFQTILEAQQVDTNDAFPTLALTFFAGDEKETTTELISRAKLTEIMGEGNLALMRTTLIALIWLAWVTMVYNRIKTVLK